MSANNKEHHIIFQSKNQEKRLLPWILYHKYQGFDKFIYFDDYSEDNSVEIANDISKKYDIDILILKTDKIGPTYSFNQTQSSNMYGGFDFVNRIVRSYNRGIDIIKQSSVDDNIFVAFLDIDEFLVSDLDSKISSILENQNNDHLYIQSYDLKNVCLDDFYISNSDSKYRWCEESRKTTEFKERGKSVIKLKKLIEPLKEDNSVVHTLYNNGYIYPNSKILRIHHFRIPCLSNSIKFIEDDTLINKSKEVMKYYGL